MKVLWDALLLLLALTLPAAAPAAGPQQAGAADGRFVTVDVYVDAGRTPLAAWQADLRYATERARLVGVEGGEHPAFAAAPHYDPRALHEAGRVVLAAFSTAPSLPTGRARVARLHLFVEGPRPLEIDSDLEVAADREGTPFQARLELQQ